ncbi:hypothetical protein MHYP_G00121210 [Metynnis hypsauchen]
MTYKSRECGAGSKSETLPRTSETALDEPSRDWSGVEWTVPCEKPQCSLWQPAAAATAAVEKSGEPRFHHHEERHNGRFWIKDVPVTLKSRVGLHFTLVQKSLHRTLPQRTYIVNTHSKNWRTGDVCRTLGISRLLGISCLFAPIVPKDRLTKLDFVHSVHLKAKSFLENRAFPSLVWILCGCSKLTTTRDDNHSASSFSVVSYS